jgi:hypothetical protein
VSVTGEVIEPVIATTTMNPPHKQITESHRPHHHHHTQRDRPRIVVVAALRDREGRDAAHGDECCAVDPINEELGRNNEQCRNEAIHCTAHALVTAH